MSFNFTLSKCVFEQQTTQPTRKPTRKPTSKPTMKPTNVPTRRIMSPTNKPTSSTVESFRKFGQGFCLDASNAWYSGVASFTLPLSTTDAYCLAWCSQNLRPSLVAVEISRDTGAASTTCYCPFSGGAVPSDINLSAYSPAAGGKITYPGVGAIQSTDDTANAVCYQNIVRINVS